MHEARWSRAKDDADKRRTRGQHFSSGHFERKKRTRLTAVGSSGTFRACCGSRAGSSGPRRAFCGSGSSGTRRAFCGSGEAREAPVEHSAAPGQARAAPVEYSAAPVEPSAAPGRARAAFSSHLRLRASWGSGALFWGVLCRCVSLGSEGLCVHFSDFECVFEGAF